MEQRGRYLIVDGHSVIFAWPELRKLHERRSASAREALIKRLRDYQDWTGVRVVVVFDGSGPRVSASAEPGDIQIFYSRRGQTADSIVERLAGKYAGHFDILVATADAKEQATVTSFGASCVSAEGLRDLLREARASTAVPRKSG
jgi:predicted RNA-binding protein with PIN domain